jgi:hypothetical protein
MVELAVRRSDGPPAALRVEVRASSATVADAVARSTVSAIAPGISFASPAGGSVSAAWLPWSWQWSAAEIPVEVAYNPTGAPAAVGPSVIIAGLQAWSSVSESAFRYHYAGVTENVASILEFGPDGENVISWASLPCDQGCVLGITSKESAHEVDMLLNSNPSAAEQLGVGDRVDWRTVVLHELGHMAGLEHSCPVPFGPCTAAEADAVMYFQYRGMLRKLTGDDITGIANLYPLGSPSPTPPGGPPPSPTPTPFPELVVIIESGWNLVVLPPGPISPVAAILPCIEALYSWQDEAWIAWLKGLPASLQNINQLDSGRAYWAHASSSCAHIFP